MAHLGELGVGAGEDAVVAAHGGQLDALAQRVDDGGDGGGGGLVLDGEVGLAACRGRGRGRGKGRGWRTGQRADSRRADWHPRRESRNSGPAAQLSAAQAEAS